MATDPTRRRFGGVPPSREVDPHSRIHRDEQIEQVADPTRGRAAGTLWNMEQDPTRPAVAGNDSRA